MSTRNSAASRDFPTPAEPSTVKSWHVRSWTAWAKASRSRLSSVSRPTIGVAKLRGVLFPRRDQPERGDRLRLSLQHQRLDRLRDDRGARERKRDRKSTRLNSSHPS